jgi:hypothetical protein
MEPRRKRQEAQTMRKSSLIGIAALVVVGLSLGVSAVTDTATSTVSITFSEIAVLDVSGDPGLLTIAAPAAAGDLPADQLDTTTTMSWTCNVDAATTRKVSGSIESLFSGIDLYATIAAPGTTEGTSAGQLLFAAAATDYDFITTIGDCNVSAQTITFRANVSAMVAPYVNTQIVITWTLTEDL